MIVISCREKKACYSELERTKKLLTPSERNIYNSIINSSKFVMFTIPFKELPQEINFYDIPYTYLKNIHHALALYLLIYHNQELPDSDTMIENLYNAIK